MMPSGLVLCKRHALAFYVKNIYFRTPDGVAVTVYAPSTVRWEEGGLPVALIQETDYPLSKTVKLRVECASPVAFALRLRIPEWVAGKPTIQVNGRPVSAKIRSGFAVVRRQWRQNDTLTLELPMQFRTEPIEELHRDTVAMLRGPLVYVVMHLAEERSTLPELETMRAGRGSGAAFSAKGREQAYMPFYFVRDQSYTMVLRLKIVLCPAVAS